MRTFFIVQVLLVFIFQPASAQKSFEGIIVYKVSSELKQANHPYNEYYSNKYGDTLTIYFREDGSQKRTYSNSGNLGLDWALYDQNSNLQYAKWHSMDSVFYYDCAESVSVLQELSYGDDRMILGKKCSSIFLKVFDPIGKETMLNRIYFSGDEYADPKLYTRSKSDYADKIYELSKSHFLRWEMDLKYVRVYFEAIEVKEVPLDPDLFVLPEGIDLVRM